jgi:hypothetical protein
MICIAFETLKAILQGKTPIDRPVVMRFFPVVLASVKKSTIKKRLELEQTFFL